MERFFYRTFSRRMERLGFLKTGGSAFAVRVGDTRWESNERKARRSMKVVLHARGLTLGPRSRNWILSRLTEALGRFAPQIAQMKVQLVDANGPSRGGDDKECRLVVQMQRHGTLVIQDRDARIGPLVKRVSERLSHSLSQRYGKLWSHREGVARRKGKPQPDSSEETT